MYNLSQEYFQAIHIKELLNVIQDVKGVRYNLQYTTLNNKGITIQSIELNKTELHMLQTSLEELQRKLLKQITF